MKNPSIGDLFRSVSKGLMFPFLLVTIMLTVYLVAMHSPTPRDLPIAIAGDAAIAQPMADQLTASAGGAFEFQVIPTAEEAREAVEGRDVAAALVLAPTQADIEAGSAYRSLGGATAAPTLTDNAMAIYVASAAGASQVQTATAVFQGVADSTNAILFTRDLVPLPQKDSAGISLIYLAIGFTLSGYVTISVLSAMMRGTFTLRNVSIVLAGFGAFMSAFIWFLTDIVIDAVDGNVFLIFITGWLTVMSVGLGSYALNRLVGPLSTILAMAIFVAIGMPASGATMPVEMMPAFFQWLHPIMPYTATAESVRSILYFDNAELVQHWMVLAIWGLGAILLATLLNKRRPQTVESTSSAPSEAAPQALSAQGMA